MNQEGREDSHPRLSSEELNEVIEQLCHSKAKEFRMFGYEQVTGEDIWHCVSSRYTEGIPALYKVVNDILSLKSTTFMNWLTMQIYKR